MCLFPDFMDSRSDCYLGGYLLIPTGNVVNINSRNPVGGDSDILSCTYRFKPQDSGAVMDVRFNSFTLSDCDITLRVELSGANVRWFFFGFFFLIII